jgi:hypothetical protein
MSVKEIFETMDYGPALEARRRQHNGCKTTIADLGIS